MRSKYKLRSDGRREFAKRYNGKVKHFYGKTDAEIDNKIAEYEKSLTMQNTSYFEAVADAYWEQKQKDLSINTWHGYEIAIKRAKEEFENVLISEITAHDVYNFLAKFKSQGYSQKVISNTKSVLSGIFDYAFLLGDITTNPCAGIPAVKGKAKIPRQPATDNDIAKIEECKTDSLMARMFYFMLFTGARKGEAAALQQKDIDIKNKKASIYKTLAYGRYSTATIKMSPKTEAGIRDLVLLENVIEILPHYDDPETYIFFPDGLPRRRAFDKAVANYREEHNIQATPHQLRHSYASMLHSAGIDVKDAQQLLGHASISMTQDIYTHLNREHKETVRQNLDNYVQKKNCSSKCSSEVQQVQ